MLAKPSTAAPHARAARSLPGCTCALARDFAVSDAGPSAARDFSSSAARSPRLSDYAPKPSANGPPPLSLRVKRSLTQRDRIAGVTKSGVKLPFGETEWGRRIARQRRIADRASKVVARDTAQRQLDATKREEALQMTAALPALSDDFMREFYAAVMAPPEPDQPALSSPPPPALPRPDILAELEQRVRLAQLEAPTEPEAPVASTSTAGVADSAIGGRTQLLEVLDSLEPIVEEAEAVSRLRARPATVPNVATLDEWMALAAQASEIGRIGDVVRVLQLMQRSGSRDVDHVTLAVLRRLSQDGRDDRLHALLIECANVGLSVPSAARELPLELFVRQGDLIAAQHQLRFLEEGGTAPASSSAYALVMRGLLDAGQPGAAFDLFAHMRLAAHSVPSVEAYNVMIDAAARGDAPERALDLRRDMDENNVRLDVGSFTALILACARGPPEFYVESLRLLRQMLQEGLKPTRDTLQAVLHGAMRNEDLARARWVFDKMCAAAEEGEMALAPDAQALRRLFHTYAVYRPGYRKLGRATASPASTDGSAEVAPASQPSEPSFPGPMPRTHGETLKALRATMRRALDARGLRNVRLGGSSGRGDDGDTTAFGGVRLQDSVIDAYLDAVARHGKCADWVADYHALYSEPTGVAKTTRTYASLMHRCRRTSDREPSALQFAAEEFEAWRRELGPHGRRPETELGDLGQAISRLHADAIFCLAKLDRLDEALAILQAFVAAYPPRLLTDYGQQIAASRSTAPQLSVRLSSREFKETSTLHVGGRLPPLLLFKDLYLLFHRFREREDQRGQEAVGAIAGHYQRALEWAERLVEGRNVTAQGVRGRVPRRDEFRQAISRRFASSRDDGAVHVST